MADEPVPERLCTNCDTPLMGEWCHACGQRDADIRVAFWRLLGEMLSEAFEADGRLARTLPLWLLQPGKLVRDFVDGHRQRYTSPVRLLVFALATGFLLIAFAGNRGLDRVAASLEDRPFQVVEGKVLIHPEDGSRFEIDVSRSSLEKNLHKLDGMNQRQASRILLGAWFDAAPTVFVLLIPVLTLLLEAMYPRHLVIEHLLLATLLHSQGLILFGLAVLTGISLLAPLVVLWTLGQLLVGMRQLYGQSWPRTLAKFVVVASAHGAAIVFLGVVGSTAYALWSL